jgi:hypothetical protein
MLVGFIIGGEIGFWVLVLAGLVARYPLRRRRVGAALLASAPVVDLVLLVAATLDLRRGGQAGTVHALAAGYIGVSVGFGHQMIRWADERFAHRFAGGPAPAAPPKHGRAHAAHERAALLRHLLAWAVACGLMAAAIWYIGDAGRTRLFWQVIRWWTVVLVIDAAVSLSYTWRPRRLA